MAAKVVLFYQAEIKFRLRNVKPGIRNWLFVIGYWVLVPNSKAQ